MKKLCICLLATCFLIGCSHKATTTPKQSKQVTTQSLSKTTIGTSKTTVQTTVSQTQTTGEVRTTSPSTNQKKAEEPQVSKGSRINRLNLTQQYQERWNWCAPTTVSMMLAYRGVHLSQAQLAQEMGTDESFGTHNADAIRILNRHLFGYDAPSGNQAGYRKATVTDASSSSEDMHLFKERFIQNTKDGYPVYLTIDNAKIYPGKSGEHNVAGIGYQLTDDGKDIAFVYYLDPSYAVKDSVYGGLKKVTPEELLNAMLTCVEPNYAW